MRSLVLFASIASAVIGGGLLALSLVQYDLGNLGATMSLAVASLPFFIASIIGGMKLNS